MPRWPRGSVLRVARTSRGATRCRRWPAPTGGCFAEREIGLMIRITVHVPEDRSRAGFVRLSSGLRTFFEDAACASADATVSARRGNPACDPLRPFGHPPLGHYRLAAFGRAPEAVVAEYGETLLSFEPVSGPALDAESYGRLALLAYGGGRGSDRQLRRTQGGLRLSPEAMQALVARVDDETEVELRIVVLAPRPWWAFCRRPRTPSPLSRDGPRFAAAPLDEATLGAALKPRVVRRAAAARDHDDDRDRFDDHDRRSSSSSREPDFRGGGGTGGGGGASGSWDATAPGRGPGVDAAGRVIGAAAAAAVVGGAVAATAAAAARNEATEASSATPDAPSSDASSGAPSGAWSDASSGTSSGATSSGASGDSGGASETSTAY